MINVPNDSNEYLVGTIQIPSSMVIINITKSYPMVVTVDINPVSESNTYIEGQLVKLFVPITYKMFQADGLQGKVLSNNGTDITLDIDSTLFDSFIVPSGTVLQPASLAPSGSRNLQYTNGTNIVVPFQSLNNRGN